MTVQQTLDPLPDSGPNARDGTAKQSAVPIADDKAMLRAARELTKDIATARPSIYWLDMLISAGIGYGALAGAILAGPLWLTAALGLLASLALYRALMFIHELTHIHRDALPGFRLTWNMLVGVPMLMPSFMYEGVHTLHHARTRYGTAEDPEYLPLALMKPWTLPAFVLIALLAPIALIFRFAVLVPLGAIIPPIRTMVWQRFSALSINPSFRRRPPEGYLVRRVFWTEAAGAVWAWTVIAAAFFIGWKPLLIALAVLSLTAVLNQLRTLVAHLWENEGEPMTVTAQYLDSVNVPPPGRIADIWAPVGLRYHGLHHLLPSVPYHSLGEAHRRLSEHLEVGTTFHGANHKGMMPLIGRIASSTMRARRPS